jgi:anti-sigma factor RsiW
VTRCQTIRQWLSASLDGEVSAEELAAVEGHLEQCGLCRQEAELLEGLKSLVVKGLKEDPGPAPPPWFAPAVAARHRSIRRRLFALPVLAAAAVAGLALAWFLSVRPSPNKLLSVYDLKPVEHAVEASLSSSAPPPVDHYLKEHVIQASSAPPIDSQGLVEYVGFHR